MAHFQEAGYGEGDRLPGLRPLAAELGLGTTVIRDGLIEAQARGWLEIRPRSGTYLLPGKSVTAVQACAVVDELLSKGEFSTEDILDARVVVETATVSEAAQRRTPGGMRLLKEALEGVRGSGFRRKSRSEADEAFHLAVAKIAGNQALILLLQVLLVLQRPEKMKLKLTGEDYRDTLRAHMALYDHILEGDTEGAVDEMRRHLRRAPKLPS